MAYKLDRARQRLHDLRVNSSRDVAAVERAVDYEHAVEPAGPTLIEELGPVAGLGCEQVGELTERVPGSVCTAVVSLDPNNVLLSRWSVVARK